MSALQLKSSLLFTLAFAAMFASGCELGFRSNPSHVFVVDVSPDGKYVASIDQIGRIRVWDLESRRLILSLRRPPVAGDSATGYSAMALRGSTGALLYECARGTLCSRDIRSGAITQLVDYAAPPDKLFLMASSDDGERIAMGTLLGSALTYDATADRLRVRKPRDIWSIDPLMIYLLEGSRGLDYFLTATELATTDPRKNDVERIEHREEGFIEFRGAKGPMWRGATVWPFGEGLEHSPTSKLGFRVRGTFRLDGGEVALCEEGGPWIVLSLVNNTESTDISLDRNSVTSCYGIRYLDAAGKYLGVTTDGENRIWLSERVGTGNDWKDAGTRFLRHIPGNGARPMTSLPERNWVFIGLMSGGVDWYEFDPDGWPSFSLIAHLSNEAE